MHRNTRAERSHRSAVGFSSGQTCELTCFLGQVAIRADDCSERQVVFVPPLDINSVAKGTTHNGSRALLRCHGLEDYPVT